MNNQLPDSPKSKVSLQHNRDRAELPNTGPTQAFHFFSAFQSHGKCDHTPLDYYS